MSSLRFWLMLLAWLMLYGASYWQLLPSLFQNPHYSHIPLLLPVVMWLLWRQRTVLVVLPDKPVGYLSMLLLLVGLLLAIIGQLLAVPLLIFGSQLPVLAGILTWYKGNVVLVRLRFELGFMLWLIPLPAFLIEQITQPLRNVLTDWACVVLQAGGYPATASGALLFIGPYRLFVEDACSGLHSIQVLCALGMLYLYCQPDRCNKLWRAMMILPLLAILGNGLRILLLSLLTYHFGDLSTRAWHATVSAGVFMVLCWLVVRYVPRLNQG